MIEVIEMRIFRLALGCMGCLIGLTLLSLAVIAMPRGPYPITPLPVAALLSYGSLVLALGVIILFNPDWYRPRSYYRAIIKIEQSIKACAVRRKWTTDSRTPVNLR